MTRAEKIGLCILLVWSIGWLIFFGYLIAIMPDYGSGVFSH